MVDRVAPSPSLIPVPKSNSPKNVHNGDYTAEPVSVLPSSPASETGEHTESHENGMEQKKASKLKAPKDLLVGNAGKEKGFETFLMTGDMIIKTNQRGRQDGSGLERHHSDSAAGELEKEKVTFKRSASSPDQSDFTGAIFQTDSLVTDTSLGTYETTMDRKPSAESGFEDQAFSSDAGMSEKQKQIPLDPNSVSDLSEIESDEFLTNMTGSQCSAVSSNLSPLSTPSDLRSDISVNTVLQQEVEPLLHDGDSSSSIDISSADSSSGEIPADIIFERSMSDSGGMSPLNPDDVNKLLTASKSAEKIMFQKQSKQSKQDPTVVRPSKSHENYFGTDVTFIDIDIDDTAYSLDQIPQPVGKSTRINTESQSAQVPQPDSVCKHVPDNAVNNTDRRVFMPSFINIEGIEGTATDSAAHNEPNDTPHNSSLTSHNQSHDQSQTNDLSQTHDVNVNSPNEHANQTGDNYDTVDGISDNSPNLELILDGLFCQPPTKHVDLPSAQRLAKRLYNLDGFRKSDVSRHLSKK